MPTKSDEEKKSDRSYRPQRKRVPYGPPSRPRRTRGTPRHLQLQPRDVAMLAAIWENRVLTQELVAWLFPAGSAEPPQDSAALAQLIEKNAKHGERTGTNIGRRLAKLYHEGFVDRIRTVYAGPLIYALADKGAQLLKTERPDISASISGEWREKNRTLSQQYLNHALMIARVRCALTVASSVATLDVTHFQRDGRDLKAEWTMGPKRYAVVPDAFIKISDPARSGPNELAFFLEADQSTMHSDRMQAKFQNYAALMGSKFYATHYGVKAARVLTITPSPQRADNLAALIAGTYKPPKHSKPLPSPVEDVPTRKLFLFASVTEFHDPRHIFAKVWRRGDDPKERAAIVPHPLPLK